MRKLGLLLLMLLMGSILATPAFAQTGGSAGTPTNWVTIASVLAIAIAAGLAAQGQGKTASSACEAMARNPAARPGIMVFLIVGLAFIESLVLFTLLIIFIKAA
jgi:F-type H+-transporting ATPase subunit c